MFRLLFLSFLFPILAFSQEESFQKTNQPLTQKQIILEKQKIEIDRKKLKLEREKFELYKQKKIFNKKLLEKKKVEEKKKDYKPTIYIGGEFFSGSGNKSSKKGLSSDLILDGLYVSGSSIKIGTISNSGHRFDLEIGTKNTQSNNIDMTNIMMFHTNVYYVGDFPNKTILPYFKFGIGKDDYKYEKEALGNAQALEANFGAGFFMAIKKRNYELSASIVFHEVVWSETQSYDENNQIVETDLSENYATLNLGINFLF